MPGSQSDYRFDVAFSFAGPHRDKVRTIAELVAAKLGQDKVFFDEWYEHEILGDEMDVLLQRFYHEQSRIVVADLSDVYADRPWCQAEARAIRALRFDLDPARDEVGRLRLLNARFGDGNVPGVFKTTAYLDGIKKTSQQCAELILKRHALHLQRTGAAAPPTQGAPATSPPPVLPSPPISPTPPSAPPIIFYHPATHDELYSRREKELAWLDDCANNKGVRIATVTGVGGLGKTSLVGHWIESHHGWQHRAFRGIFFYSFYSNGDSDAFFSALLAFVCTREKMPRPASKIPLHRAAATILRRCSYLVVLDGLEALQQGEEDPYYGWIADGEVNEFVARVGQAGQSLLVLTSRFPFPEVTRDHPEAACALDLPLLTDAEGADLLVKSGLSEARANLEGYSRQFGGHPLALRIFAGACVAQPFDEPEKVSALVRADHGTQALPDPQTPGLDNEERSRRKQRRQFYQLLRWFQAKLPAPKRRLLQLVALFREPVPTTTLIALATGLEAMKTDFGDCDAVHLRFLLDTLVREHLLQREDLPGGDTARWAAHPIVREVFRAEAFQAGDTVAKQFAEIVAGKSADRTPKNVTELQPILEAIEVLLAAEDFEAADDLYSERLDNGWVFTCMPAPEEGLRCARGFIEPEERRTALEQSVARRRLPFYLHETATFRHVLGQMEEVERGFVEANEYDHARNAWNHVSTGLRSIALSQTLRGQLRDAIESASEALFYAGVEEAAPIWSAGTLRTRLSEATKVAISSQTMGLKAGARTNAPRRPSSRPAHNPKAEHNSRVDRANACSLAGQLCAASREYAIANAFERAKSSDCGSLYSLQGIQWCHHRLRLGEITGTRRLTGENRSLCKRHGWNDDLPRCDLLLGELDMESEDYDSAARRISEAIQVFREVRLGVDLPDALLAQARLRRSLEDCEEALRYSSRSGLALKQCDALNLRALLKREAGEAALAREDARKALEIAERCEYYWGRHEALRQLRDAANALGNRADEKHWNEAEKELAAKMKPEIKEALRITREHDTAMEKLYGAKKKRGKT